MLEANLRVIDWVIDLIAAILLPLVELEEEPLRCHVSAKSKKRSRKQRRFVLREAFLIMRHREQTDVFEHI
ncbi:hypothetical protein OK016_04855 [Vibrio chagasii]|nr:hypothetical protein [Vibrio chagasii]